MNSSVQPSVGYIKTVNAGETHFRVTPERPPFPSGIAALLAILCVPALGLLFMWPTISLLLFGWMGWILLSNWQGSQVMKYRRSAHFVVSKGGIGACGKSISTSDIHRLIIRNHVSESEQSFATTNAGGGAGFAYAASNAAGVGVALGHQAVHAISNDGAALGRHLAGKHAGRIEQTSFRVDVEAGGVALTLAGGMNETTAFGLMSDVMSALGRSSQA